MKKVIIMFILLIFSISCAYQVKDMQSGKEYELSVKEIDGEQPSTPPSQPPTEPPTQELLEEWCGMPSGLSCMQARHYNNELEFDIQNSAGIDMNNAALSVKGNVCTFIADSSEPLSDGQWKTYSGNCPTNEKQITGTLEMTFTNPQTGLQRTMDGGEFIVNANIEECETISPNKCMSDTEACSELDGTYKTGLYDCDKSGGTSEGCCFIG